MAPANPLEYPNPSSGVGCCCYIRSRARRTLRRRRRWKPPARIVSGGQEGNESKSAVSRPHKGRPGPHSESRRKSRARPLQGGGPPSREAPSSLAGGVASVCAKSVAASSNVKCWGRESPAALEARPSAVGASPGALGVRRPSSVFRGGGQGVGAPRAATQGGWQIRGTYNTPGARGRSAPRRSARGAARAAGRRGGAAGACGLQQGWGRRRRGPGAS